MNSAPKLLILEPDSFSESARQILRSSFSVRDYDGDSNRNSDAEVMIAGLGHRINHDFLNSFPNVKLIATTTTGLNHVDTELLENRGIALRSLRDVQAAIQNVSSTAELSTALIFALSRRVVQGSRSVENEGAWNRMKFFTPELRGQSLGIIGYGRIGRKVSATCQALGLTVKAFDPYVSVPKKLRSDSLSEIVAESNIISIHADYRGSQIIGKTELNMCNRGAMLVNTARGELIDERAVAQAILSGAIAGYAADVLAGENVEEWEVDRDELTRLAKRGHNVILTPHLGGCTWEAFEATQRAMATFLTRNSQGTQ